MSEMVEKCPVCKTECRNGATLCSVCGFSDELGINREWLNKEDTEHWFETVVKPYRAQWEAKKREAELLAQDSALLAQDLTRLAALKRDAELLAQDRAQQEAKKREAELLARIKELEAKQKEAEQVSQKQPVQPHIITTPVGAGNTGEDLATKEDRGYLWVIVIFAIGVVCSIFGVASSLTPVSRGNTYYNNGDYERAIAKYTEAIRRKPKYADAYNGRGNAYYSKGDYDRAISDYNEAIRLNPKLLNPKFADAYKNRGAAYYKKGDYDRAIADYNEAIRLNPTKDAIAYNGRGNAYHSKGDYDRAITDYTETIRLNPNGAIAYSNRGYAYYKKGDYDRAIADFNETIRLDPKYANAYNNRGHSYFKKGDYDRANADYAEAKRLDPRYNSTPAVTSVTTQPPIPKTPTTQVPVTQTTPAPKQSAPTSPTTQASDHYNRGTAYYNNGDYDRAITEYAKAIRLDPKYAIAYNDRGTAYYNKGDYDRAIADFTEAIRLVPTYAIAYSNRGYAYYYKGDYNSAITDYNEAIRLNPKYASAYNGRGNAYEKKGYYDRAKADYAEASRLNPKNSTMDLYGYWNDTDSRLVSEQMIKDALNQRWIYKWETQPRVIVNTVKNEIYGSIDIDVETFTKDIERALLNSGRVNVVTSKSERDKILYMERTNYLTLSTSINTIMDQNDKKIIYYLINMRLIYTSDQPGDLRLSTLWIGEKKIKKYIE